MIPEADLERVKQATDLLALVRSRGIDGLYDVFHTKKEASGVLTRQWKKTEAVWVKAEEADLTPDMLQS